MIDELTDEDRQRALEAALADLTSNQSTLDDLVGKQPTNDINARNRADVDTRMASLGNGPPPMPRPNVSGLNSDRHDAAADAVAGLPPPNDYGMQTPAYPSPGMDPGELRGWSPTRAAPLKAPAQAAPAAPQGPDMDLRGAGLADADTIERNGRLAAGRQLIAGLTRTAPVESPASPADAVRQLYARRAQEKNNALQERYASNAAERNAANLEIARVNMENAKTKAERDAALFEYNKLRNARTDDRADKSLEATTNAKQEELRLREEELARKKAAGISGAAAKAAEKEAGSAVDFYGGLKLKIPPGLGDTDARKVREKASMASATLSGMDGLEKAIGEYVANPGLESKNNISSQVQVVATAMNAALGQGAMSGDEKRAISEALGADVLTPTGAAAVIDSLRGEDPQKAGRLLLSRIRSAKKSFRDTALAGLRYGYNVEGADSATPATAADGASEKMVGGKRYVKTPDGWALKE